jgi:hypothetical protein
MASAFDARATEGGASPADSLRTAMQQDSLTPATSSRSPTCRQLVRTQLPRLAQPLTLANAPRVCGSPSSGVWSSVSCRPLPPGLMVDPASDRLCHQPGPDSRGLYRLRRGGRTQKGCRRRSQCHGRFRCRRGSRRDRVTVGGSCRADRAWRQGPVAAPHRFRAQHALVAAVLRHCRLARCRNRGHCDSGRRRLRLTGPAIMPNRAAIKARRPQTRPSPATLPTGAADRPTHHASSKGRNERA